MSWECISGHVMRVCQWLLHACQCLLYACQCVKRDLQVSKETFCVSVYYTRVSANWTRVSVYYTRVSVYYTRLPEAFWSVRRLGSLPVGMSWECIKSTYEESVLKRLGGFQDECVKRDLQVSKETYYSEATGRLLRRLSVKEEDTCMSYEEEDTYLFTPSEASQTLENASQRLCLYTYCLCIENIYVLLIYRKHLCIVDLYIYIENIYVLSIYIHIYIDTE